MNITHGNVNLVNDTIEKFGIRAGIDLNKIIKSATNNNFNGFSINGDVRIKKSLYVFSEVGSEEIILNSKSLFEVIFSLKIGLLKIIA